MKTLLIFQLYRYQKERFPVVILALSIFPALLSASAVMEVSISPLKLFLVLIAAISYLFHIRVIDEYRDFDHDNIHHPHRPIQVGVIDKQLLRNLDYFGIAIFFLIALNFGNNSLLIAFLMFLYTSIASRDFFLGQRIRDRFFLYNTINMVQLFLMNIFIYFSINSNISFNNQLLLHFTFVSLGAIIFELIRKLEIPKNSDSGNDTYTLRIGLKRSLLIYSMLSCILLLVAINIHIISSKLQLVNILFFILCLTGIAITVIIYWVKKNKFTEQLLQAVFLMVYIFLNLSIFLNRI